VLDDPFLGCRVDESLDRLLFLDLRGWLILGKMEHRHQQLEDHLHRPNQPHEYTDSRHERRNPIPAHSRKQK
jgi:hypothetical protein